MYYKNKKLEIPPEFAESVVKLVKSFTSFEQEAKFFFFNNKN